MPDDPSASQPTPTNYQRTTGGGHLRWQQQPKHPQEMLPACLSSIPHALLSP